MAVQGHKLALVVRPFDAVLAAARYLLVPLLLAGAGFGPLLELFRSVELESPLRLTVLAVIAAALLSLAVMQAPTVSATVERSLSRVRRRVLVRCGDSSMLSTKKRKLNCRLVLADMRLPMLRYDQQVEVVSKLTESAISDRTGDFWVIEGPSGSGKTRTAYLLADALLRDPSEFTLADKVRYFDLVADDGTDSDAVLALDRSQLDGTITILDNFHRVGPRAISKLTSRLLDSSSGVHTRLLVLLAQPTETWKLSPGADVRLVSEARRRGRHLALEGAPGQPLHQALESIDESLAESLRQMSGDSTAAAAQLHISRFAAANPQATDDVARLMGLLSAGVRNLDDRRMAAFLGVVAALSMHRGFFVRSQFARSTRLAAEAVDDPSRLATRVRLWSTLRRMRRMGLVPWVRTGRGRYVFHEAVAQLVIERLIGDESFAGPFMAVGTDRLASDDHAGADIAWMIAAELGATSELDARFDSATLSGAFAPMASTLERVADRMELPDSARMQLALLYDRTGQFARAREVIGQRRFANDASRRAAEHCTARIEVSHDDQARTEAGELMSSDDPLIAAAGRYWRLHMDAHAGRFAPDELHRLSAQVQPLVDGTDRWAVFTVARVHFDHMRHLYLSGRATAERIAEAANSPVSSVLRTTLPTFGALRILYTQAHLCAHVVLPRLALEHGSPTQEEAQLIGVNMSSLRSADNAAALAHELYGRARDEFAQYGDREALYLAGDIVNAELMIAAPSLLDSAEAKLHSYAGFIRETGFADLASLPHLYFCRYHILSYYDAVLDRRRVERTPEEHLGEARRHLREAAALDYAAGNAYGQLRADVFGLLLDGVKRPISPDAVEDLQSRADHLDYVGLSRTLATLATMVPSSPRASTEIRSFLRFTPVVHQ